MNQTMTLTEVSQSMIKPASPQPWLPLATLAKVVTLPLLEPPDRPLAGPSHSQVTTTVTTTINYCFSQMSLA